MPTPIDQDPRAIDWSKLENDVRKNRNGKWERPSWLYRLKALAEGVDVFIRAQKVQTLGSSESIGEEIHSLIATFPRRRGRNAASLSYEYVDSSLENQIVTFANSDLLGRPQEALKEQGQQPVEMTVETWKGWQAWRRSVLTQRFYFTRGGARIGRGDIANNIDVLSATAYIPEIGLQPTQEIHPERSAYAMITLFGKDSPINLLQKTPRRGR